MISIMSLLKPIFGDLFEFPSMFTIIMYVMIFLIGTALFGKVARTVLSS